MEYYLIFIAVALFIAAIFFINKNNSNKTGISLLLGIGLTLILFGDPRVSEFTSNLFSWKRSPAGELQAAQQADFQNLLRPLNESIRQHQSSIDSILKVLEEVKAGASAKRIQLPPPVVAQVPTPATKGTVLVFFRKNATLADAIVSSLQKAGYKSSATNSTLAEIQQWAKPNTENTIYIASDSKRATLTQDVKEIILKHDSPPVDASNIVVDNNDWSFKASDAQIYLF
jgi:hypothetical protein